MWHPLTAEQRILRTLLQPVECRDRLLVAAENEGAFRGSATTEAFEMRMVPRYGSFSWQHRFNGALSPDSQGTTINVRISQTQLFALIGPAILTITVLSAVVFGLVVGGSFWRQADISKPGAVLATLGAVLVLTLAYAVPFLFVGLVIHLVSRWVAHLAVNRLAGMLCKILDAREIGVWEAEMLARYESAVSPGDPSRPPLSGAPKGV
jgi:hypothetical protein